MKYSETVKAVKALLPAQIREESIADEIFSLIEDHGDTCAEEAESIGSQTAYQDGYDDGSKFFENCHEETFRNLAQAVRLGDRVEAELLIDQMAQVSRRLEQQVMNGRYNRTTRDARMAA